MTKFISVIFGAFLAFFGVNAAPPTPTEVVVPAAPSSTLPLVEKVVDGDTIKVRLPDGQLETVRFLGIDTPETVDPNRPAGCFGKEASNRTKELLTGKSVRLEADPKQGDRDKYQRLLRYIYLPDGTLVNAELVAEGFARVYTAFPTSKQKEFLELQKQARLAGRGLWNKTTCAGAK